MARKDGNKHFHNGRPASRTRKARKARGKKREAILVKRSSQ